MSTKAKHLDCACVSIIVVLWDSCPRDSCNHCACHWYALHRSALLLIALTSRLDLGWTSLSPPQSHHMHACMHAMASNVLKSFERQ